MKRFGVILLLVCLMTAMASASVEVYNYSFKDAYFPFEMISGWINLSILGEEYNSELTSSENDSIDLGKFLVDNGADFDCSPPDCSNGYTVLSSSSDKNFSVMAAKSYGGFVLNGENVILTGLSFNIVSNFGQSLKRPLSLNFFEGEKWGFNEFSDNFSSRDWGCYNPSLGETGPLIGTSSYCEMIGITETGAVYVGAEVLLGDTKNLTMTLYPENAGGQALSIHN